MIENQPGPDTQVIMKSGVLPWLPPGYAAILITFRGIVSGDMATGACDFGVSSSLPHKQAAQIMRALADEIEKDGK